jgi:hypothetical protein
VLPQEPCRHFGVGEEPAAHTALQGLVERPQHLRGMIGSEPRQQDGPRGLAEEIRQHHRRVPGPAPAGLRARPDQLGRTRAIPPLGNDRGQLRERPLAPEGIQRQRLGGEQLQPLALEPPERQREREPLARERRAQPLQL